MSDTIFKQELLMRNVDCNYFSMAQNIQQNSIDQSIVSMTARNEAKRNQITTNSFELEKQLHEQFAKNNNAKLGALISLIAALVGIFVAYSVAFIKTDCDFANGFGDLVATENASTTIYHIDVLLLAASVTLLILAGLFNLTLFIGVFQRGDQFIVHAIRLKHYKNNPEDYRNIYPQKYCPMKQHCIFDICLSIYGIICKMLLVAGVAIIILTLVKTLHSSKPSVCGNWLIVIAIVSFLASLTIVIRSILKNKRKYTERCLQYITFYQDYCPHHTGNCGKYCNC